MCDRHTGTRTNVTCFKKAANGGFVRVTNAVELPAALDSLWQELEDFLEKDIIIIIILFLVQYNLLLCITSDFIYSMCICVYKVCILHFVFKITMTQ